MSVARIDLNEGQVVEIGGVPVVLVYSRHKQAVLLLPQYECVEGLSLPMVTEAELRTKAERLRVRVAIRRKSEHNSERQ